MLHDVINILKIVHISITLCTNQKSMSRKLQQINCQNTGSKALISTTTVPSWTL